jgi:N-acetylglucosaminyldiphosphoundecaprenol N-acetyl-beta-D-mannosaminyltransferase
MAFRTHVLGIPLDVLSAVQLRERARELMSGPVPQQAITANALLALDAEKNAALRSACLAAALMLPESAGMRWALSRKNIKTPAVAGIDLAWELCELCAENNWPIFLLGGSAEVLDAAAQRLKNEIPNLRITGTRHGFFSAEDDGATLQFIKDARPKLTLVALGMPKQDIWISRHLSQLPPGLYMGVGGSFDVWAGRLKRAPRWAQRIGFEWCYRLYQEPWRWPRMLALPRFAWKVCREKAPEV